MNHEEGNVRHDVTLNREILQKVVVPVWAPANATPEEIANRATMALDQDEWQAEPFFKWEIITTEAPTIAGTKINWKMSPLYHIEEEKP